MEGYKVGIMGLWIRVEFHVSMMALLELHEWLDNPIQIQTYLQRTA